MTLVARKIGRGPWITENLSPEGTPSDVLHDFRSTGNRLSLYLIEDDLSDLPAWLAALCVAAQAGQSNNSRISNFDYAVAPQEALEGLGFELATTPGNTPDDHVNRRHRELQELTADRLVMAANLFHRWRRWERVPPKEVGAAIAASLEQKRFHASRINDAILTQLTNWRLLI